MRCALVRVVSGFGPLRGLWWRGGEQLAALAVVSRCWSLLVRVSRLFPLLSVFLAN